MGAEHIVEKITGKNLQEAFAAAQDDAGRSHGYEYSGTISMARGIVLHPGSPQLLWDAEQLAETFDEKGLIQKWESARAVAIATPKAGTERTAKLRLQLPGALDYNQLAEHTRKIASDHRRHGEGVLRVEREESTKWRKVVTVPKEPTIKRFRVDGGWHPAHFSSQAEARARAEQLVEEWIANPGYRHPRRITVIAETVRANGDPLVTVEPQPVSTTVTFAITYAQPDPKAPVAAWMVAGIYAS